MISIWIILLLSSYVKAQSNQCFCFCCTGQSCTPKEVGSSYLPSCTSDTCSAYCRNTHYECRTELTNGNAFPFCQTSASTISPLFNCRCDCCNTGSPSCPTTLVGYSTAFVCQTSACSISCGRQHPQQCVSNQYGQTIGTCISNITTTTTAISTTTRFASGYSCSCRCCQSGPDCSPNVEVGTTVATYCSASACTSACQNRYPAQCPSMTNLGHTNGICTNDNNGNTRCRCQCCNLGGCSTSDVYTYNDCSSCTGLCQQRCGAVRNVTYTCGIYQTNHSVCFPLHSPLFFIFISLSVFRLLLF